MNNKNISSDASEKRDRPDSKIKNLLNNTLSLKGVLALLLCSILLTSFLSYIVFSNPDLSYDTVVAEGSMNIPYSYVLFNDTTTYYARNGQTGDIDFSGTNETAIVESSINALPNGGTIFLKEFQKPNGLTIPSNIMVTESYKGHMRDYTWSGQRFRTVVTRSGVHGLGLNYYDSDGYYVSRVSSLALADHFSSMWTLGELFHFGTYQCTVKVDGMGANRNVHAFGLEKHHGWAGEGLIWFSCEEGVYKVGSRCPVDGTYPFEQTTLVGEDWTYDTVLKFEWSSSQVKFYSNDTLKATHTLYIPQEAMMWYIEVYTGDTPPAVEFGLWQKDFMEILT